MINIYKEKREQKNAELRILIDKMLDDGNYFLDKYFKDLDIAEYRYDILEAMEELCLDRSEVIQLVEDYVIQILKSKSKFDKYIDKLIDDSSKNIDLDYGDIVNLAHKNLGVARNLRIKDASIVLEVIMSKTDLDYLRLCAKALEILAVKLNPKCAYDTLSLIRVKNSL
ncbi:hypothetical protein [Sulfurimonas sp.]|uniref:hypothetical protein n=1 Tax=Sulfurimonas sp. TaxID=2022749 RepID=UPI0025E9334D|nr:hypothetical protein [Sulfurimonas sp.]MDD5156736.1 hypothetical protein [Sulfurimonas sp.]